MTAATVTNPGSGYTSTPSVTVTDSTGSGCSIVISNELDAEGGPCDAKYITRKVTLEDGFDAQDIKLHVTAYKPQTASLVAYVKILSVEDPENFDDKPYIELVQETPSSVHSLNEQDYREFIFRSEGNALSYTDDNGTKYKKFKTFSIKLGLLSTNTTDVPRIKDLRALALDE